jgi:MFS family permease
MRWLLADTTPLRNGDFRRLWLAGIVTVVGANLTIFAVPVQIYALTQNSAYVGLSGIFALVPLLAFGLLGGAWADAMDRRTLLIIASCGLAVASLLLWLQAALSLDDVWVVLCLLAVQQAFYAVNSPTRSAAIPRMLPGHQLPAANALNMTVTGFGAIVGPLLAGVMLNWVNLSTLYLIDALTCVAPIWATFRLAPMPVSESGDSSAGWGMAAVLAGFRYLAGNTVVLMSFVVDLIAMVLGMPRALFPQLAHESFGGPIEGGTTMALLAAALAFMALGGVADTASAAFRQTILQEAASDDLRGRLQGVFVVVVAGGPRLGDAVHGAAAAVIGTSAAAAGGGALVLVGMVIAVLAAPAFVRYRGPVPRAGAPPP